MVSGLIVMVGGYLQYPLRYYSGTVAGAREGLICGVPAISLSLNWKRGKSAPTDFAVAAGVCLPLIKAALHDLDKGVLFASLFLSIEIPTFPSNHKGFKVTKQGTARYPIRWCAASPQVRGPSAVDPHHLHSTMSLEARETLEGDPLAGGSPFGNTQSGAHNSPDTFCQQNLHFRIDHTFSDTLKMESNYDFGAVEEGFIAVTPLALVSQDNLDYFNRVTDWIATLPLAL
ncbi:hypothetical protein L7F22_066453 [Adiantum nelumboides]|nr:hypothetical protein [Adiantum nelumboides]